MQYLDDKQKNIYSCLNVNIYTTLLFTVRAARTVQYYQN
jgi:hypothetical protein